MVVLAVVIHARAATAPKPLALASVAFMAMCAAVTCGVHFCVLVLSRQPLFLAQPWAPLVFAFQWPSVAYALDILTWDLFFPLSVLFAAPTVQGSGPAAVARRLMYASGALALAGLAGVPLTSMEVRNVGIIGYAVIFPVAAALLARLFGRQWPGPAP